MSYDWRKCRLHDVISFNPSEKLAKGTIAKKISMDVLRPFSRDIPAYTIEAYSGGTKFRNGDTIMARITPCLENGKTALVNILDDNEVAFGSTEYIVMRAIPGVSDPNFIYYLATSPLVRNPAIKSMVGSSGRQRVQQNVLESLVLPIPPLYDQQVIASILKSLDDKIEKNTQINDNLQQQAETLFRTWFVDYEPFDGVMPSDWRFSTLGESTDMGAGGDKPKITSSVKTAECPYPIYSNGLSDEGLYGYTDIPKIRDESVTVSARGTIGFVCLRHIPYVPIVRLVTLIPNTELMSAKYLYLYLNQLHISGTGTTQQQLTVPDFRKTEILIPSKEVMARFTAMITPLFHTIWSNQEQNGKLASLRDTLLPKLMTGEIDVSDIQL